MDKEKSPAVEQHVHLQDGIPLYNIQCGILFDISQQQQQQPRRPMSSSGQKESVTSPDLESPSTKD
ncbi:hypothetical protein F2Q69_00056763 [Brassica cretica]|uniref:Uncharacterized protein n=1 Tax=Brassica cretica TaxID=69181 RepID=A0A8S9NCR5_BRACR|nr:hypothetical protein F2Q69_00056763 [Brassica cretica]